MSAPAGFTPISEPSMMLVVPTAKNGCAAMRLVRVDEIAPLAAARLRPWPLMSRAVVPPASSSGQAATSPVLSLGSDSVMAEVICAAVRATFQKRSCRAYPGKRPLLIVPSA